jgi:hypothetical protein
MTRPYKATRLAAELLALKDANGMIRVAEAEAWAKRHTRSHLHAELEWDDTIAGPLWRQQQIRQLIAVHVLDDGGHRSMVSLSIDRTQGGGYREIVEVMKLPNLREIMLNDALEDLRRLQQRYQRLTELAGVWAATEQAATAAKGGARRKRAA